MPKKTTKTEYPFYYPGSGVAAARKSMSVLVCFKEEPSKELQEKLLKNRPQPFDTSKWTDSCLEVSHDSDSLSWVVAAYESSSTEPSGEEANSSQWKAFNNEMDEWLLACHKLCPIFVVIKPVDDEYWTEFNKWHEWSMEKIPEYLPQLSEGLNKKLEYFLSNLGFLWTNYFYDRSLAEQKKILNELPKEVNVLLEKYSGSKIEPK
ncbi:MAG TPA: hypothetical protein VE973_04030 [Candidatus Limnocylindria bacterium]|nr:hypothetical protein [Candidatus Limnocylindria bacterium]